MPLSVPILFTSLRTSRKSGRLPGARIVAIFAAAAIDAVKSIESVKLPRLKSGAEKVAARGTAASDEAALERAVERSERSPVPGAASAVTLRFSASSASAVSAKSGRRRSDVRRRVLTFAARTATSSGAYTASAPPSAGAVPTRCASAHSKLAFVVGALGPVTTSVCAGEG